MVNQPPPHTTSERAFSLIELLVVMVIVSILLAVAIPTFLGQKDSAGATAVKENIELIRKTVESCSTNNADGSFTGCTESSYIRRHDKTFEQLSWQQTGGQQFNEQGQPMYDVDGISGDGTMIYSPTSTEYLDGFHVKGPIRDGDVTVVFHLYRYPDGRVERTCVKLPTSGKSDLCRTGTW